MWESAGGSGLVLGFLRHDTGADPPGAVRLFLHNVKGRFGDARRTDEGYRLNHFSVNALQGAKFVCPGTVYRLVRLPDHVKEYFRCAEYLLNFGRGERECLFGIVFPKRVNLTDDHVADRGHIFGRYIRWSRRRFGGNFGGGRLQYENNSEYCQYRFENHRKMMVYLVPEDKFETAFARLGAYFVCLHMFGSG
jgi:hypothetical protein